MDVFIPEEYVIRRRIEKKAAAAIINTGKRLPEAGKKVEKEKKTVLPSPFRFDSTNEFLVPAGGIAENVVFSCFSA
ncbi:hypothetical protein CCACVL1_13647 [Corchorus capsularis]|uniref:Uncharacterized protein n=1 Tax=Corchorus capsularis TaxID=210143 RepID=A0A1R3IAB5_COCAP|nr:hypothetical protein CCACVL1_13647 [Corchorus capsularis]